MNDTRNVKISNLQNCQLDILKEIIKVCEECDIKYFLLFGSCLGAVRHNGFIPWDDDIDVGMLYEDFCKFNKLSNRFKEPYFLQNSETDPEYGLMISRVRNSNTTLIEANEVSRNINHGVFVDVYPLFDISKEDASFRKQEIYALLYRFFQYNDAPYNHGWLIRVACKVILKVTPNSIRCNMKKYCYRKILQFKGSDEVSDFTLTKNLRYKKKWFEYLTKMRFEDIEVPIPMDYDSFLTSKYGDYMKLPPKEKQKIHHEYYKVDLEHSYKEYRGEIVK